MKNYHTFISGLLLTLVVSTPVFADDTEIFIGSSPDAGKSNVILSIDTSGSMAAHVINFNAVTSGATSSLVGHPVFDPNAIYDERTDITNDNRGCRDDYVYNTTRFLSSPSDVPTMPYVAFAENSSGSNTNDPSKVEVFTCRRDSPTGSSRAGIYNENGNRQGDEAFPIANIASCPAAKAALETVGYFQDADALCTSTSYYDDELWLSGKFLDFVRSQVNANGYPVINRFTDTTRKPWSDFFVESRLDIVKDVVNDIITNNENYNINLGLMRFNNSRYSSGNYKNGGLIAQIPLPLLTTNTTTGIKTPNTTSQNDLKNKINNFVNWNGTPLEESYYESYLYFAGKNEAYGEDSVSTAFDTGSTYKSPITHACQTNSIILLTDGDPSGDEDAKDAIKALYDAAYSASIGSASCSGSGTCMDELAKVLNEQDLFPTDVGLIGPDGNTITTDLKIKQTVQTNAVGFFNDNTILNDTATAGGGISRVATNADDLKAIFAEALSTIIEETSSFVAPSVSVNNFNRLTNDDELYFTLFEPKRVPVWTGNIKQYKLLDGEIVDADDNAAVDLSTGSFLDSARSFWTPSGTIDGNDITEGGFTSRLTTSGRRIYSNLDASKSNLSAAENRVNSANISDALINAVDATQKTQLMNWIYGLTTDASNNIVSTNSIGDPLHSSPIVLSYPSTTTDPDTGLPEADQAIFITTNTGFLHALDPSTSAGTNMELFSFIPQDLLPRVKEFAQNNVNSVFPKAYALDGPISSWIENDDGNQIIETNNSNNEAETAHLYITQRRGGKSIYALDVTDRSNPEFEWQITGGAGGTPGFEELGQTWSKITPATIPYGTTGVRDVLIFAGGYDPDQDEQIATTVRTADDQGRAIYIIDATDGELLWRGVPSGTAAITSPTTIPQTILSQLLYSIPSNLTVIDVNTDSIADRIYVGDMGGQLWRLDILPTDLTNPKINVAGGVIADLGGSTAATNRKFFTRPSVSRVADDASGSYLAIAIGSGKRAAPKSTQIQDSFYMIKDPYIFYPRYTAANSLPNYNYVGVSRNITDIAANIKDITDIPNPEYSEIGTFGWKIRLEPSEKVLTEAVTADGTIFFTSYVPVTTTNSATSCDPTAALGSGRLYGVSTLTGAAAFAPDPNDPSVLIPRSEENNNLATNSTDRFVDINSPGIPPSPQIVIAGNDGSGSVLDDCASATSATLLVGAEAFTPPICTGPVRTYWNRYDTDVNDL